MKPNRPLRTLPIEGISLRELVVEGIGKRASITFVATDDRQFRFGISDFSLGIATRGAVLTEVKALDDLHLRVRYSAERLVFARAQVDYPGTDDEWAKDIDAFTDGRLMSWALSVVSFELVGGAADLA